MSRLSSPTSEIGTAKPANLNAQFDARTGKVSSSRLLYQGVLMIWPLSRFELFNSLRKLLRQLDERYAAVEAPGPVRVRKKAELPSRQNRDVLKAALLSDKVCAPFLQCAIEVVDQQSRPAYPSQIAMK